MRCTPFLALLPLLFASCIVGRETHNEPLVPEKIAALTPGTSTATDVVEILGAPSDVVQLGKGSAYRYDFVNTKRAGIWLIVLVFFNEDTRSDRVWVFFDEDQRLTHMGSTLIAADAEYAMPWEEVHE